MSEPTRPEASPPDLRSRVAEIIDTHVYMDAGGWNINRASLRRTSEEIHALYATTVADLQRERDEARALVEDMQGRLAELTEDVRVAREAARPPAPWRTLGQVIRGGGQP